MGNAQTQNVDGTSIAVESKNAVESNDSNEDVKVVVLRHPGTCSGMFWRGDPTTKKSPPTNDNWPRNGALLKGSGPHVVAGENYFKVFEIQQAGTKSFVPVPDGTWMLYNQGGLLLHDV
eukprot:gene10775-14468_t